MFQQIEKWYSGKALTILKTVVLPGLQEASKLGYWPKGMSRKVTAALNKQTVAAKFSKANRAFLENLSTGTHSYDGARGWDIEHAMYFGHIHDTERVLESVRGLRAGTPRVWSREQGSATFESELPDPEKLATVLATAEAWAHDFEPVSALVKLLDARKVPATVVMKTLSPSVVKNLGERLNIQFDTIESPPIRWEWRKGHDKKGKPIEYLIGIIEWPKGTKHNMSRYASGSKAGNEQCHACGHAIQDPWNWLPIMAKGKDSHLSLWVGRDCARKLFGCEVEGDSQYER